MLLIIIIIAFILTILLIECSVFCYVIEKKEKVENIYLDTSSDINNNLEFLENVTDKTFTMLEYSETVKLNLDNTSIVFFDDYDIFLNNTYKLNKFIIYPIDKDSVIDIINYDGNIITIYVN